MKLCVATGNPGKLQEVRTLLENAPDIEIVGLNDIGFEGELPENQETLEGNAEEKARYIYETYGLNCFADDTGLEVDFLGGAPGVYSARYADSACDPEANMQKLLSALDGQCRRSARFRTVIALIIDGETRLFEGTAKGRILTKKQGEEGFGYDPIFLPEGFEQTFAQMSATQKNKISHRGKAVRKLIDFLLSLSQK